MEHWSHLLHERPPAAPVAPRRRESAWPGARVAAAMVAFVATVLVLLVTSQSGGPMQSTLSIAESDGLSLPPAGLVVDDEAAPAAM